MDTPRRSFIFSLGGFACAAAVARPSAKPAVAHNLSVFLADTHISPKDVYKFTFERLQRNIDEILAMRPLPARVVVLGDIAVGKGLADDYKLARKAFDRLAAAGIELHFTMGNHDHRRAFAEEFPEYSKNEIVANRFVSIVNLGYMDLVLLDSLDENCAAPNAANPAGGTIDPKQLAFVRDVLVKHGNPFICAAHHGPGEMTCKIGGKQADVLQYLKECENYRGWVQGHAHRWSRLFNVGNSKSRSATFRRLILPSSGYWGDIGYVTARSYPDKLEFTLEMRDFYYPSPISGNEAKPKVWQEIVREKTGEKCTFY